MSASPSKRRQQGSPPGRSPKRSNASQIPPLWSLNSPQGSLPHRIRSEDQESQTSPSPRTTENRRRANSPSSTEGTESPESEAAVEPSPFLDWLDAQMESYEKKRSHIEKILSRRKHDPTATDIDPGRFPDRMHGLISKRRIVEYPLTVETADGGINSTMMTAAFRLPSVRDKRVDYPLPTGKSGGEPVQGRLSKDKLSEKQSPGDISPENTSSTSSTIPSPVRYYRNTEPHKEEYFMSGALPVESVEEDAADNTTPVAS
ncbi:hypothetical protein E8E13_006635 [Curvularia kusanoi]|uniref:Uncharacterized protein n=1 Tax=Curvularia kusanoi TaxID=90978 RepID=A0A9P4TAG4_CURKU|nr:hypothetical protein E8E13_006635 [Curvularia kusanoi]